MRDFLDDIQAHMDAGIGRARQHARKELPKRFYETVRVEKLDGDFVVTLDGRPCRTPGKKTVKVPRRELAGLMAMEWEDQQEVIDARTMPVMRLVNSAIEAGREREAELRDEVMKFVASDLLLYRAETPRELVELQERHWDRIIERLEGHFSILFEKIQGIMHRPQPRQSLDVLKGDLANADFLVGTCLASMAGLTGSGLLVFAMRHGLISGEEGWEAALVDENYNSRVWGEDREALLRLEKRRLEFDSALKVLRLLEGERG